MNILSRMTSARDAPDDIFFAQMSQEMTPEEQGELQQRNDAIKEGISEKNPYLQKNADWILDSSTGEIIAPAASDNPFEATPGAISAGHSSSSQSGVLRPTIGEGTLTVREDPEADFAGLNRDINRAREMGQYEKHTVYSYAMLACWMR